MNDKELMNKVFDKKCADELSAEELLSRSSKGAQVKSRAALGAVAAVAAVGVGAGAFVLLSGKGVETGTADPISPSETTTAVERLAGDNTEQVPDDVVKMPNVDIDVPETTTKLISPDKLPVENLDDGSLSMDKSVTMVRINGSREEYGIGLSDKENKTVADWIERHKTDTINGGWNESAQFNRFDRTFWQFPFYNAKMHYHTDDGYLYQFVYGDNAPGGFYVTVDNDEQAESYLYCAWYSQEQFDDTDGVLDILKKKISDIGEKKYNGIWLDPGFEVSGTDTYPEGTQSVSVEIKNNTNAGYWVDPMWEADRLNEEGVWEEIDLNPDIAWAAEVFKLEAGGTLSATAPIDCFELTFTPGKYRITQHLIEDRPRADDDDSLYTKRVAFEFTIK